MQRLISLIAGLVLLATPVFAQIGINPITGQVDLKGSSTAATSIAYDDITAPDADSAILFTSYTNTWTSTASGTFFDVDASSGKIDFSGVEAFEIPNAGGPTVDAFGEIAGDNNLWAASRGAIIVFDGTAATALLGALVSDTPTNGQVPKWKTGGFIEWEDDNNSGSATAYDDISDPDAFGDINFGLHTTAWTSTTTSGNFFTIDAPNADAALKVNGALVVAGTNSEFFLEGSTDDDAEFIIQTVDPGDDNILKFPDDDIADDDLILGSSTATQLQYAGLPDCDSSGNALNYDQATNAFSCRTGLGGGTARLDVSMQVQSAKLTGGYVTHTPSGCGTTASTQGATIEGGDGLWKLLFDDTTDEAAVWQFRMPNNYSSSPVLVVDFAMASGEANEVEYEAAIMCYTPTTDTADIDTESFADCAVGTATTVSASAGEVYSQSITLTDDSCAAGDMVWVWLSTDADDGTNDDATGDREVIGVTLTYTGS